MRVSSLRELFEVDGAVELTPGAKYLVRLPDGATQEQMVRVHTYLEAVGIAAVIVTDDIKFYRIED